MNNEGKLRIQIMWFFTSNAEFLSQMAILILDHNKLIF